MALKDTRREDSKNVKKIQVADYQLFAKHGEKPTGQYKYFVNKSKNSGLKF